MTSTTSIWDQVAAAALLGTERRPLRLPATTGALAALVARLNPADPEWALLGAAAIAALHRRAGARPVVTAALPVPPSEPDTSPECSSPAGQHLAFMLDDQYEDLLPEWLATAAARGLRVPAEHLPALLDLGADKAEWRTAILAVLGQRGGWLAAQRDDWRYASGGADAAETWQTGSKAQRTALLAQLRSLDPARARELAQSTWRQEAAPDRWAFVQTLRIGLSSADEPFLEDALDDRARDVRAAAAELLKQLPDSRLCARMAKRVQGLIKWQRGKKPGFQITLPEACDAAMERDGVLGKPTRGAKVIGEKSYWLAQMANALPLAVWEQLCGETAPAAIVAAAARSRDWSALLLDGLREAAIREGDRKWLEVLLAESKVASPTNLLAALPVDRKEAFVLKLLAGKPSVKYGEPATPFLFVCQHSWSEAFTRTVLGALYQDLTGATVKYSYQFAALLDLVARHMAPALIPSTFPRLAESIKDKSGMAREMDRFLAKAQFRLDMLKALGAVGG